MVWASSKEELLKRYPKSIPLSFRFISASVYDNPYIEDSYIAFLQGLPKSTERNTIRGSWNAREEGSSFFQRSWCTEVPIIEEDEVEATVRAFDFAGTLKSDKNYNPDYTATARMRRMKSGVYVVDDIRRDRILVGDWEEFVLNCVNIDPENTIYLIPRDPQPSSKAYGRYVHT